MFNYLFGSGSISPAAEKAIGRAQEHIDGLEERVESLQEEVQRLKALLTETQLNVGILIAANQNLADDVVDVYNVLKQVAGISSSKHSFRFSFRDDGSDPDDDMSN